MTPERAKAVLELGAQYSEFRKYMTADEIAYVTAGWKRMPGSTCFHDALIRVAHEVPPFNLNPTDDQLDEYVKRVQSANRGQDPQIVPDRQA